MGIATSSSGEEALLARLQRGARCVQRSIKALSVCTRSMPVHAINILVAFPPVTCAEPIHALVRMRSPSGQGLGAAGARQQAAAPFQ